MKIDANNSTDTRIKKALFQIGILADDTVVDMSYIKTIDRYKLERFKPQDGKFLYLMEELIELLPGAWESLDLIFVVKYDIKPNDTFGASIRLISETVPEDIAFRIKFVI